MHIWYVSLGSFRSLHKGMCQGWYIKFVKIFAIFTVFICEMQWERGGILRSDLKKIIKMHHKYG